MPANQLPYFPLHVDDYLNDLVVIGMDADTEGCYISLLVRAWKLPEPGQIPEHLVPELSRLHRVSGNQMVDLDRGNSVLEQLAEAFDTESRPGWWIQKRMVVEHRRILNRNKGFESGARKTNKAKAIARLATAKREPSAAPTAGDVDLEVDLDSRPSASIESKSTHLAEAGASTVLELTPPETNGKADEDLTFAQLFDDFYDEYPRKVKRPIALRAWKSIKPQTQATVDAVFAGRDRWADHWRAEQTPADKIPYPATFLNGRQWEDKP